MGGTVWPEGTTGVFSLLNLLFTSVVVFMAGGGTMMYLYRRSKGLPPKPTRGKILQGNLRAALWLEYMAWSGSGVETHHTLQEGAALRVRDLENQLFEDPQAPQQWASTLSNDSDSPNSSTSSCSSSSRSSIDETLRVKSNTSQRPHVSQPHVSQPQNSTADGAGSATTKKNNGKIAIHNSISSAHSAGPSRISAADKTHRSARHVLTTPPKAHRPTSSNENKSPRLPLSHSHIFQPSTEDYPTRSARIKYNLRTSSNSYTSSNIYPSLGLD